MKKLVRLLFCFSCVTSAVSFCSEELAKLADQDIAIREQPYVARKTIHIEEKLSFLENKIEELEVKEKEFSEENQVFKESFAVGVLGALSALAVGNMRVAPLFIVAALFGLSQFRYCTKRYITSQFIGSVLGAQLLFFL